MNPRPSARALHRFRILLLTLIGLLLVWLPIEDLSERWVLLFASLICALAAARFLLPIPPSTGRRWLIYALAGTLAGLSVTPVALFLMAFKSGIHGHGRPDFTSNQVSLVIERTPIWIAAGILIGLGSALWRKSKS